jgi:hypothetical protein
MKNLKITKLERRKRSPNLLKTLTQVSRVLRLLFHFPELTNQTKTKAEIWT